MRLLRLVLVLVPAALLAAAAPRAAFAQAAVPPDLILHHGRILTVDRDDRIAEAIAITGSRIVAVGTDAEVLRLAGPATRRIDLGGRAVTPGLIDAHAHFSGGAVDRQLLLDVSYPAVRGIADIASAVRARADTTPAGTWIEGAGWDEGKFIERRMITAADLDRAAPRHPVVLTNTTGHYSVVNSAALRLAGITRDTPDPPAGTIDRHADGTPSGVLKESAQGLVSRLVPPPSRTAVRGAMRRLAQEFAAEGMTGLKDPGISAETFEDYRALAAEGALPVRVFALFSGGQSLAQAERLIAARAATTRPYASTGDDHVIAGGVKLFADGSGGARTAWLYDEWNRDRTGVDTGNRGYPAMDPDTLRALIRRYHAAGMHVSVHAIGDRMIDWVVDSYAEALREHPVRGLRHGIIHANIPTDRAIATMARLEREFDAAYPEPSATFHWWIGDTYAANFGARAARLNPFRTFQRNGIPWANGSDFSVTPFAARYGIWASVARTTLLERYADDPFGRAEAVDVHAALRAATIWAAHQLFLEAKVGSLEVGKYADLAVWDRDPYTVPTAELKEMRCLLTLFGGRVVYAAQGTAFAPQLPSAPRSVGYFTPSWSR
ncbi:MAG: amidohydrolase family protein [Gemmatimonadaceae bacterium]|nr:amidohydrolase family protein [Gemmatimonadaceae bacterium]